MPDFGYSPSPDARRQTEGTSYYFVDPNGHKIEMHASDLATRIATAKQTWGDAVHWFV